jgi:sterol desaturase/sphingolipid hydroxylase (fatty acid hydroxylase superfamily)
MDMIYFFENLLQRLSYWLPVYFLVLMVGETVFLLFRFKKAFGKETRVNLATGIISIVVQAILKTIFFAGIYPAVYEERLWEIGIGLPAWVIGFLLYTFIQFGTHFLYHKVRLFWCLHEVHHSATNMNITTGLRTSVFDIVSLDILYLLIPLVGVHPLVYFIIYTLNKFWGAFIHINERIAGKIPFLEYFLVTPSAHHIHHARNIRYLDKNYGEIVPWFDMLFGTYVTETEKPEYGTLKVQHEMGFWESQLHEFRSLWKDVKAADSWKHKLGYLFMPPGWEPGDDSETAYVLQQNKR